uniref:Uncharacterized protein n=1 Tax=Glossina palpalis gambiensis TaxID=67801 RepID=A0A1B0AT15_9MUSC
MLNTCLERVEPIIGVISLSFINEQDLDFMLRNHIKDLQARTQLCDGVHILPPPSLENSFHSIKICGSSRPRHKWHTNLLQILAHYRSGMWSSVFGHENEIFADKIPKDIRATNLKCHECNSVGDYTFISAHDACEH